MNATKQFFSDILNRHRDKLWWLHSSYSLLLGIGVMWLGTKNFAYLRLAVFHIAFIWLSSLALPLLGRLSRIPDHWHRRLRLLINYFQRNFYQQLLFFILPIYYLSATWGAGNMLFVLLLALAGFISFSVTLRGVKNRDRLRLILAAALLLAVVSEIGRPADRPLPPARRQGVDRDLAEELAPRYCGPAARVSSHQKQ